jgi:hypothetical protein
VIKLEVNIPAAGNHVHQQKAKSATQPKINRPLVQHQKYLRGKKQKSLLRRARKKSKVMGFFRKFR